MKKIKEYIRLEWIGALILLFYPLRKINMGIDLMDAGYALGNYLYFDGMNETWKFATYLSNVIGRFFMYLPFGDTWVGMNFYCGLLVGICAAGVYLFVVHRFLEKKLLLFIAELVAISLCWSPYTILYHYLGYILMTLVVILLYIAMEKESTRLYFISGVILGLCVLVRMPNVTYMALIIPVWYDVFLRCGKIDSSFWKLLGRRTGICIGGYIVGLLVPIGYISVRYGIDTYPKMIEGLFGMTDTATDYKPTSMLTGMIGEYFTQSIWLLLFVVCTIAGVIFFRIKKGRWEITKKICYVCCFPVLLRLCYGRGMFDFQYDAYFCFSKWLAVYLLAVLLFCAYILVSSVTQHNDKLWASFLMVIILVTPLGGNNALYPMINSLFLVAPISVYLVLHVADKWLQSFPIKSMLLFLGVCITTQSVLFGWHFVFHDTTNGEEKRVEAQIPGAESTKGLMVTVDKHENLAELGGYLAESELLDKQVILYGDIPAIAYMFEMEPAIYTTWADLASNPYERLMQDLEQEWQELPVLILSNTKVYESDDKEYAAIMNFALRYKYQCTFENEAYQVYTQREN